MNTSLFRTMLALAATFATLAGARPVNAKTYYVDWYTGNDNNAGASPALAWKSINAGDARGLINAGDVIQVAQGIYRPIGPPYTGWDFNRGGTSTNHVVYHANGPVRVDGNYAIWYLFNLNGTVTYVDFDGFEFARTTNGGVYANSGANNVTFKNCRFHDIGLSSYGWAYGVLEVGSSNFNYQQCAFYDFVSSDGTGAGILLQNRGTTSSVYNCTFHNTCWSAIRMMYGSNVTFKNNIVSNASMVNMFNDGGGILTHTYNLFYNNTSNLALETGESVSDPYFASTVEGDFNKSAGSPAIDTGTNVGLPYLGSAPDRGAWEYNPSGITTLSRVALDSNLTSEWGGHTFGYLLEGPKGWYWSARRFENGVSAMVQVLIGQYPKPGSGLAQVETTFNPEPAIQRSYPVFVRTHDGYLHVFFGCTTSPGVGHLHYFRSWYPDDASNFWDFSYLLPTTPYTNFTQRMNVGISEDGTRVALAVIALNPGNLPVVYRGTYSGGGNINFTNPVNYTGGVNMSMFYPHVFVKNNGEVVIAGQVWDQYPTRVFERIYHLDANNGVLFTQDLWCQDGSRILYDMRPWNGANWDKVQMILVDSPANPNATNYHEFDSYDTVTRSYVVAYRWESTTYSWSNPGKLVHLTPSANTFMINNPSMGQMASWWGNIYGSLYGLSINYVPGTDPVSLGYQGSEYVISPNPLYGSMQPENNTFYIGTTWINANYDANQGGPCTFELFTMSR